MNWKPLYEGEPAETLRGKLFEIRQVLEKLEENKPNLLGGAPGLALFHFYLGRATGDEALAERGMERISAACDVVEQGFAYPTFAGGLAGLGWSIAHLANHGFIEADVADVLDDLTEPLHTCMLDYMKKGEYDYLHGALGIALYFLDRPDLPKTKAFLQELVDELFARAQTDERGGLKWEAVLNIETGQRGYNLSLSHGQASIIDILARMVQAGYGGETAQSILDGAVTFLLGHEIPEVDRRVCFFPSWITTGISDKGSRLAWCYGDLGLGQVLLHTGQRMGQIAWQEKGLAMLRHSLRRQDPQEAGILDAGLCHGSAGLAHIYNRLWQETGEEIFAQAARHWFDHTLKLARFEDGPAGYKAFRTPQYGDWVAETGLLEGVAGIGLSIISALYAQEPAWDRALLLS